MNRIVRIGLIVVGILLVFVVVAGAALVVMVRRPFPATDGTLTVSGLQESVEIYRDEYGVPHIYAQNRADLFFAQGYVHAQDRFWQMEFWRHTGQGRLSEIVGEATVDSDKFIRTMGWNRMAAATAAYYEEEQPDYYALLEAYSAGVNAYIEENRNHLSINQTILNLVGEPWPIEPWTPVNTVSWGVVMSDVLSRDMFNEIRRAKLIEAFGEANVTIWHPFYPYEERPVIAPTDELTSELPAETKRPGAVTAVNWSRVNFDVIGQPPDPYALGAGPFIGSNSWVVGGEHTASGLPLLANDPHLGIQMPSIWYEIGLHAPDLNVTGFSFAGVPGVVIGHNDRIAWGVTNSGTNVQDLFIEKINPSNPNQYEYMGQWQDMEIISEVIKVNGGEDVTIEVRLTRHGPIINDVAAEQLEGRNDVLAVQWTAEEPSRVLQSIVLLNEAQNYDDFRKALRYWDIPSQSTIYADVEGNIAYQLPGLTPIRRDGDGLLPVPGWTGEYEWEGWVPYEELPAVLNPEKGYIVTANHAVVDEDYPHHITWYWDNGNRGQRINEMLTAAIADGAVTADDLARIQFDSKSLTAVCLCASAAKPVEQRRPDTGGQRAGCAAGDLQERRDSVPAALFEIFFMHLARNVLLDDVGETFFDSVAATNPSTIFFQELADEPGASWWDDTTTPEAETQEMIILQSLADTIGWFEENVGGEMNEWTWGRIHTATFVSTPLGRQRHWAD